MSTEQEIDQWISNLQDDTLREIARLKRVGFGDWDIANRLNRAPRTIERKVALLRRMWRERPNRVTECLVYGCFKTVAALARVRANAVRTRVLANAIAAICGRSC